MLVAIGIGSNIDPESNLKAAATMLREEWPGIRFSSVVQSKARDHEDQRDFLNAVAIMETDKSPKEILNKLQFIEQKLKKNPSFRFGPRTIDLDLLLYGENVFPTNNAWKAYQQTSNALIIPHPRMHERRFVLEPLCSLLSPNALHPMLRRNFQSLLNSVHDQQCTCTTVVL